MNISEKLRSFFASVIESANAQSAGMIEEYTKSLKELYEERHKAALKKARDIYRMEHDTIIREKNRRLSHLSMDLKRSVLEHTADFTDRIFEEVAQKLKAYMKTDAYKDYLKAKIIEAAEFARGDDIIIYINPTDEALKPVLEEETNLDITISNRDFVGGMRAVIPSRTILIDHSFMTKLSEARDSFTPDNIL